MPPDLAEWDRLPSSGRAYGMLDQAPTLPQRLGTKHQECHHPAGWHIAPRTEKTPTTSVPRSRFPRPAWSFSDLLGLLQLVLAPD